MKKLFYCVSFAVAAAAISGCALFGDPDAELKQFVIQWNNKMDDYKIDQIKAVVNNSIYSDYERQTIAGQMISALPEDLRNSPADAMESLKKQLADLKLRRTAEFKKLSQAISALKPARSISAANAEDALENGRKLMKKLVDFKDFREYPAVSAKLDAWLLSLFLARPKLVAVADQNFRNSPSEANSKILAAAFCGKTAKLKNVFKTIWKNYESVRNADAKFALFLKAPDEAHWGAFKSQVSRIGYPANDPVRRRYAEYIQNVDHCRRIFFTLKYWELADTGFINRKQGDIGIRIWSGQNRPFIRQIAVENADRNWHSDSVFLSKGHQKKISHPLIARSDNDIIRMVCIHFQNSSGRTVESPIFEYSIYQLAALTYKTGSCELKLEGSPVNHEPGSRRGLVVMDVKDMPKLEIYSE